MPQADTTQRDVRVTSIHVAHVSLIHFEHQTCWDTGVAAGCFDPSCDILHPVDYVASVKKFYKLIITPHCGLYPPTIIHFGVSSPVPAARQVLNVTLLYFWCGQLFAFPPLFGFCAFIGPTAAMPRWCNFRNNLMEVKAVSQNMIHPTQEKTGTTRKVSINLLGVHSVRWDE